MPTTGGWENLSTEFYVNVRGETHDIQRENDTLRFFLITHLLQQGIISAASAIGLFAFGSWHFISIYSCVLC